MISATMPHPAEQSRYPKEGRRVTYAIVHDDDPRVFIAEDDAVLERVLALELVAATPPADLGGSADRVRELLLAEQWGLAIQAWMAATDTIIDMYPDEAIWLSSDLTAERSALDVRMSALFRDEP